MIHISEILKSRYPHLLPRQVSVDEIWPKDKEAKEAQKSFGAALTIENQIIDEKAKKIWP